MKFKVVMDSGKEYIIDSRFHYEDFVSSLYNEIKSPLGATSRVMKNTFMFIDDNNKILFNPTHISSIEVLD